MVVYFSGTGNSRFAAERIARRLNDQIVDAGQYFKGGESAALVSEQPWVFVSPTYGWRLPRVFSDFIRRSSFSGSDQAYFVMTCGGSIGGAVKYIVKLCGEKHLRCRGVAPVVMPENYVAMFNVPDEDEAKEIVERAVPVIDDAAERIAAGENFKSVDVRLLGMFNSMSNGLFYAACVKDKRFVSTEACVGCGKCVELCQLGNISLENGKPKWHGNCTHCMACICLCPQKAIEYGAMSVGKPRYRCPEIQDI